jgi:hypothetical protein
MSYPACSGPCNQGRKPCPTKQACAIADLSACAPTREETLHAWAVLALGLFDFCIWRYALQGYLS